MAKLQSTIVYGSLAVNTYANVLTANVLATTASTSTGTGALVIAGGAGVGGVLYANNFIAANTMVGTQNNQGPFAYGLLSYTDTNILASFSTSTAGYAQLVLQNTSSSSSASSDITISNNLGTASTYYANFGINSGSFAGSGSFNAPNNVYLSATSGNLVLGTTTSNAISFVTNSGTTDVMTLAVSGAVAFNAQYGSIGQALISQGTATSPTWAYSTQLSATAGGSNVIVTASNVNVSINSSNVASFGSSGLQIITATASASTITGALQVAGGVGIGGTVWAQTVNTALLQAVTIGNTGAYITGSTATFGNVAAVTIGNTGSTGQFNTINAGAVNSPVIGNVGTAVNAANITITGVTPSGSGGGLYISASANIIVNNTAPTVSGSTGAVVIAGGLGIGGTQNAITTTNGGALTVAGGAAVAKDLWVGGNLYVANIVSQSTTILAIADPLVYLVSNAAYPYNYDIGFYSHFIGGPAAANTYAHTGLVRDYVDGYWKFFSNVAEPNNGLVNFSDANLIWDTVKTGNLILVGAAASTGTGSGALQITGGAGITGSLFVGATISGSFITGSTAALGNVAAVNFGNTGAVFNAANVTITGVTPSGSGGGLYVSTSANIIVNNAAPSTSTTTGAVVILGGMGISGQITSAGNILVASTGNLVVANTASSTTNATGALVIAGGVGIGGNLQLQGNLFVYAGGNVIISNTSAATTTTSGALQVAGGIGAQGSIFSGGSINAPFIGNIGTTINGGNIIVGTTGNIVVNNTQPSTSYTTGAVQIAGGVGIAGNLQLQANLFVYPGGNVIVANTAVSTSNVTGAVVIAGGLGVSGNVYHGQRAGFVWGANNVSAVYQVFNQVTGTLDTVFG